MCACKHECMLCVSVRMHPRVCAFVCMLCVQVFECLAIPFECYVSAR